MNEFFNNLQKEARNIRLSQAEKQAMRVHLYKTMAEMPAYTAAQKNALADFVARKPVPSIYHWFSPRFVVPVVLLLIVSLSTGTAFAAQSALPGDALYAVKIHVNEPVAVALATTPQAKAEVQASIATTRLEEAETLASQGTLDATTSAELADNFAEHATAAQAGVAAVAAQDPGSAAQLSDTFNSTLAAHGAILAQFATDEGSSSVQASSTDSLAIRVFAHVMGERGQERHGTSTEVTLAVDVASSSPQPEAGAPVAMRVRTFAPRAMSAESNASSTATEPATPPQAVRVYEASSTNESDNGGTPDDSAVALALQSEASSTLSQVQADFAALAPSLDASTTLQIQTQIDAATDLFVQGNNALIAGDKTTARNDVSRVLRSSVRLDAFLKAGKKFNTGFLNSLLK